MKPSRSRYYFDTNVYRKIARKTLRIGENLDTKIYVSHITYLELLRQLQRSTQTQFDEIRQAIVLARKHARRRLLHRPHLLAGNLLLGGPLGKADLSAVRKGFDLAVRIRSHSGIGKPIRLDGRLYDFIGLSGPIELFQQQWIRSVETIIAVILELRSILPPSRGGPMTGADAAAVNEYFSRGNWKKLCARALYDGIGNLDPSLEEVDSFLQHLEAPTVFLGEVLRAILVDGYQWRRKANDAYDFGQLWYLCKENLIFVTDDRSLRHRIRASSQCARVVSLATFLNQGER